VAILTEQNQKKLEELLVADKLISQDLLDAYRTRAAEQNQPILTLLLNDKKITDEQLTKVTASMSGIPYVNLTTAQIDQKVLDLLPQDISERYMAVPLGEVDKRLAVAMLDAINVQAVDFLANKINRPLKVYMASEAGIRAVLSQYKTNLEKGVKDAISSANTEAAASAAPAPGEKGKDIKTIVQDSPISRALSTILEYAVKARASDIHIEPLEDSLKIRCRIDGVLREVMKLPKTIEPALISRI
jgi:type IV pilus assembly protein PilB